MSQTVAISLDLDQAAALAQAVRREMLSAERLVGDPNWIGGAEYLRNLRAVNRILHGVVRKTAAA